MPLTNAMDGIFDNKYYSYKAMVVTIETRAVLRMLEVRVNLRLGHPKLFQNNGMQTHIVEVIFVRIEDIFKEKVLKLTYLTLT